MSSSQEVRPLHGSTDHAALNRPPAGGRSDETLPRLDAVDRLAWLRGAAGDRRVRAPHLRAMIVLSDMYNVGLGCAWPSQETLARETRSTQARVSRTMSELAEWGYVVPEAYRVRAGQQVRVALRYRLARPPSAPQAEPEARPDIPAPVYEARPDMPAPVYQPLPDMPVPAYEARPDIPASAGPDMPAPAYRTGTPGTGTPYGSPAGPAGRAPEASPDWAPGEKRMAEAMAKYGLTESELEDLTEEFCDFWRAKPPKSWSQTWWNRVKVKAGDHPPTGRPAPGYGRPGARPGARPDNRAPDRPLTSADMGFTLDVLIPKNRVIYT